MVAVDLLTLLDRVLEDLAVVVAVAPSSSCKSAHGWLGHRAA